MLIAHISICLDCFLFCLRIFSLLCFFFFNVNCITVFHIIVTFQMYTFYYFFFHRELATTVLTLRFYHHSLPCPLQISWICSICDRPAPFPLPDHDRNFRETSLPLNNLCDSKIFVNTCFFFVVKHTHLIQLYVLYMQYACI